MHHEILVYQADGLSMHSHLYRKDAVTGTSPGILVFPEAPGLSENAKKRAERLAELGYVALACDLHGEGHLLDGMESVMSTVGALMAEPLRVRARAQGGMDALLAQPGVDPARIAAIGYCFGGTMSLELARSGAEIRAAIGFHSGLTTNLPDDARNIKGKVLVCIGADDPGVDAAQRTGFETEMRDGGVDWQMHLYGGVVHSFTNPDADKMGMPHFLRYDANADTRSWAAMRALFDEVFA